MTSSQQEVPVAPLRDIEDVWSYPRPPALQRTRNRLRVVWISEEGTETIIADTTEGYRVLETSHPPTYYLPANSVKLPLKNTGKRTFCEWKGAATYHAIETPDGIVADRIWSYEDPTPGFKPLKGHLSFYASSGREKGQGDWICYVDDERVGLQEGSFYGGWVTRNLRGKMKGGKPSALDTGA